MQPPSPRPFHQIHSQFVSELICGPIWSPAVTDNLSILTDSNRRVERANPIRRCPTPCSTGLHAPAWPIMMWPTSKRETERSLEMER